MLMYFFLLLNTQHLIILGLFESPIPEDSVTESFVFQDIEYLLCGYRVTWDEAHIICLSYKAQLATLDSEPKSDFVVRAIAESNFGFDDFWIGARSDLAGSWYWVSSQQRLATEKSLYENYPPWYPTSPPRKMQCLTIDRRNHDLPIFVPLSCSRFRPFVCQKDENAMFARKITMIAMTRVGDEEFTVYSARVTWAEAVVQCRKEKLQIAEVKSVVEAHALALSMLRARPEGIENAWIGGYLKDATWTWLPSANEINQDTGLWRNGSKSFHECLMLDRHICETPVYLEAKCDRKRDVICQKPSRRSLGKAPVLVSIEGCTYWLGFNPVQWLAARRSCSELNATLVLLDSERTIKQMMKLMLENRNELKHVWTDGRRTSSPLRDSYDRLEGEWLWESTQEPIPRAGESFIPWCNTERYNNGTECLNLDREDYDSPIVYGLDCNQSQTYVCQPLSGPCVSHKIGSPSIVDNISSELLSLTREATALKVWPPYQSKTSETPIATLRENTINANTFHITLTLPSSTPYPNVQGFATLPSSGLWQQVNESSLNNSKVNIEHISHNNVGAISKTGLTDFLRPYFQLSFPTLPQFGIKLVSAQTADAFSILKEKPHESTDKTTKTPFDISPLGQRSTTAKSTTISLLASTVLSDADFEISRKLLDFVTHSSTDHTSTTDSERRRTDQDSGIHTKLADSSINIPAFKSTTHLLNFVTHSSADHTSTSDNEGGPTDQDSKIQTKLADSSINITAFKSKTHLLDFVTHPSADHTSTSDNEGGPTDQDSKIQTKLADSSINITAFKSKTHLLDFVTHPSADHTSTSDNEGGRSDQNSGIHTKLADSSFNIEAFKSTTHLLDFIAHSTADHTSTTDNEGSRTDQDSGIYTKLADSSINIPAFKSTTHFLDFIAHSTADHTSTTDNEGSRTDQDSGIYTKLADSSINIPAFKSTTRSQKEPMSNAYNGEVDLRLSEHNVSENADETYLPYLSTLPMNLESTTVSSGPAVVEINTISSSVPTISTRRMENVTSEKHSNSEMVLSAKSELQQVTNSSKSVESVNSIVPNNRWDYEQKNENANGYNSSKVPAGPSTPKMSSSMYTLTNWTTDTLNASSQPIDDQHQTFLQSSPTASRSTSSSSSSTVTNSWDIKTKAYSIDETVDWESDTDVIFQKKITKSTKNPLEATKKIVFEHENIEDGGTVSWEGIGSPNKKKNGKKLKNPFEVHDDAMNFQREEEEEEQEEKKEDGNNLYDDEPEPIGRPAVTKSYITITGGIRKNFEGVTEFMHKKDTENENYKVEDKALLVQKLLLQAKSKNNKLKNANDRRVEQTTIPQSRKMNVKAFSLRPYYVAERPLSLNFSSNGGSDETRILPIYGARHETATSTIDEGTAIIGEDGRADHYTFSQNSKLKSTNFEMSNIWDLINDVKIDFNTNTLSSFLQHHNVLNSMDEFKINFNGNPIRVRIKKSPPDDPSALSESTKLTRAYRSMTNENTGSSDFLQLFLRINKKPKNFQKSPNLFHNLSKNSSLANDSLTRTAELYLNIHSYPFSSNAYTRPIREPESIRLNLSKNPPLLLEKLFNPRNEPDDFYYSIFESMMNSGQLIGLNRKRYLLYLVLRQLINMTEADLKLYNSESFTSNGLLPRDSLIDFQKRVHQVIGQWKNPKSVLSQRSLMDETDPSNPSVNENSASPINENKIPTLFIRASLGLEKNSTNEKPSRNLNRH
ncbi:uncharacterized protein LOC107275188 isoform X2 [Cephus cinctus]|uniref:Uncharacterized protein LOC107275188 isoform X2 n=1 Tax=Cephus cinctus TaxID=211228 RepID=A0AAJ7CH77_CEPCN|nr:uncharacterized protein LOC107275188 isoform X2 [Cephus cinctus]